MPYADVFIELNREYYQLTSAERKIADYLLSNRQECQFMSISELAEVAEVAEATVSRFCRRLGYKGYGAFKLAMASSAAKGLPSDFGGGVEHLDSVGEMCRKVCAADVDAVNQTLSLIRTEAVTKAADLLFSADKVLCMGQGGSMILAQEAAHLFSTALPNFFAVPDSHIQAMRAAILTERDVVFYFSYSGATRDLVEVMKVAQSAGAKIILVTRFPKSPGAAHADVVLECGAREAPVQMGSIAARMGQLFLMDVLFNEVCRRDAEVSAERRRRVTNAIAEKHM